MSRPIEIYKHLETAQSNTHVIELSYSKQKTYEVNLKIKMGDVGNFTRTIYNESYKEKVKDKAYESFEKLCKKYNVKNDRR